MFLSVECLLFFIYLFENVFAFKEATVALLKVCQEKNPRDLLKKVLKECDSFSCVTQERACADY